VSGERGREQPRDKARAQQVSRQARDGDRRAKNLSRTSANFDAGDARCRQKLSLRAR
jgi:hypothetical protein